MRTWKLLFSIHTSWCQIFYNSIVYLYIRPCSTCAMKNVSTLVNGPSVESDPFGLPNSRNAWRCRSVNAHSGVCLNFNHRINSIYFFINYREGRVSHFSFVRIDGGVKHLERKSGRCLPIQDFIKSVMSSVRSSDIVRARIPIPNSATTRFGFEVFPSQAKFRYEFSC